VLASELDDSRAFQWFNPMVVSNHDVVFTGFAVAIFPAPLIQGGRRYLVGLSFHLRFHRMLYRLGHAIENIEMNHLRFVSHARKRHKKSCCRNRGGSIQQWTDLTWDGLPR
jgi:hypothetical protein